MEKEVTVVLFEDSKVRVERVYSNGCCSPQGYWYDQTETEWVYLEEGEAVLRLETEKVTLNKGDSLTLLPHIRHRVEFASRDCVWLCVFKNE